MPTNTKGTSAMNDTITKIARTELDLETLDTRRSDSLDFHDLAVWRVKAALEAAYRAGQAAGREEARRRR